MIYYIVARDIKTGNEWVMETHESSVSASDAVLKYRDEGVSSVEYRVDTLPFETQQVYADTDSMRTPFTVAELFPPKNKLPTSNCVECGAYVTIPWQTTHTTWHNKVADL